MKLRRNCALVLALAFTPMFGGNGAPNGPHYNLNIIGVPKNKTADMTNTSGHSLFVPLVGNTRIYLCESGVDEGCATSGFAVIDRNGTDGSALFALPNPDPDGDGTTVYSVFARALGKPEGSSVTTTCATDVDTQEIVCSEISLTLTRDKGPSKFDNVTKYLLYVYADIDGDGIIDRTPLFGDGLEDFFWAYENNGLKLAQLRFYPCSSTVPPANNSGGPTTTSCFN